jgi:hypothetical protein
MDLGEGSNCLNKASEELSLGIADAKVVGEGESGASEGKAHRADIADHAARRNVA